MRLTTGRALSIELQPTGATWLDAALAMRGGAVELRCAFRCFGHDLATFAAAVRSVHPGGQPETEFVNQEGNVRLRLRLRNDPPKSLIVDLSIEPVLSGDGRSTLVLESMATEWDQSYLPTISRTLVDFLAEHDVDTTG